MTSYAGFPGHDEIRAFMEAQQTDVSLASSTESPVSSPNTSSSSSPPAPPAPPCSLSGSSENLTPNTDTTMPFKLETPKSSVIGGGGSGTHQCTMCHKRFHHWASLNAHELVHSGKTTSRCERRRGKVVKSPKTPLTPAPPTSPNRVSPTLPRPMIPLDTTQSKLSHSRRLQRHLRRSPPLFDVTQTPVPTMARRNTTARRLIHSSSTRPGVIQCDQCGKLYSSKTKLRVHQMKRHSRELHLLLYI